MTLRDHSVPVFCDFNPSGSSAILTQACQQLFSLPCRRLLLRYKLLEVVFLTTVYFHDSLLKGLLLRLWDTEIFKLGEMFYVTLPVKYHQIMDFLSPLMTDGLHPN